MLDVVSRFEFGYPRMIPEPRAGFKEFGEEIKGDFDLPRAPDYGGTGLERDGNLFCPAGRHSRPYGTRIGEMRERESSNFIRRYFQFS